MILVHGVCHHGALVVWAEASDAADALPARYPDAITHRPHPFAAAASVLAKAIRSTEPDLRITARRARPVAMWLPSTPDAPAASSRIIESTAECDPGAMRRVPWTVPALCLAPTEAIALLRAVCRDRNLAAGVFAATDLRFWAEDAFRFAAALVARQQFLPGIALDPQGARAVWEPVCTGDDGERLATIAARMPGSARAATDPDAPAAPDDPSVEVLRQALTALVDQLVRSTVSADGRPADRSGADSHDLWLEALLGADGRLDSSVDAEHMADQIARWRRPVDAAERSPFKLCFRLEEPETALDADSSADTDPQPEDAWRVRYLLQPHSDPSLLISAADGWQSDIGQMVPTAVPESGARESLLVGLGQAAGISTRVADSLERANPDGFSLNTTEAYDFLSEEALALEEAGFGVLLPSWWARKGTRLRLSARANTSAPAMQSSSGIMSLDAIADVDWDLALGEHRLTADEIEALATMKAPLVRLRGQWIALSSNEIQEAMRFWQTRGEHPSTLRDIVQMHIGMPGGGGPQLDHVEAAGPLADLLGRLSGGDTALTDIDAPAAFAGTLRPYQARGYAWLWFLRHWGLGGCLADDMGLGKTIQALALFQRDWESGSDIPTLLVCPTSVINNWIKEASRFTPDLPVMVHHGPRRARGEAFDERAGSHALVVTSYGLLQRDIEFLRERSWQGVVLDEAQQIKNPHTAQARAARSLTADYRVALTGTPVENHLGDLWSVMEFLNPGFLGTLTDFKRNFLVPIQAERDADAAQRLRRATGPFMLRRVKTDRAIIKDLPEKFEGKTYCALTAEQASLYRAVLIDTEESLEHAEGIDRRGLILGVMTKLTQVCNHPAHFLGDDSAIAGRSGKLNRLIEMITETLASGERALIFTRFVTMGTMLQRHLQEVLGTEVLFLHGGVPRASRDRMVDRFGDSDGPPLFVLSLRAGGTGLNLTAANHVFHFDRWWNPAVENQATDRAYRIGQERNVQVHKFMCAGTLEDRIDEMIDHKRELSDQIVDGGERWLTELSNDDLRAVLTLSRDAVRG